jgi:hypothetical protein
MIIRMHGASAATHDGDLAGCGVPGIDPRATAAA